jgi:hypothetical protein
MGEGMARKDAKPQRRGRKTKERRREEKRDMEF